MLPTNKKEKKISQKNLLFLLIYSDQTHNTHKYRLYIKSYFYINMHYGNYIFKIIYCLPNISK